MSTMHNKRLKNEQIRDKWGRNVCYNKRRKQDICIICELFT